VVASAGGLLPSDLAQITADSITFRPGGGVAARAAAASAATGELSVAELRAQLADARGEAERWRVAAKSLYQLAVDGTAEESASEGEGDESDESSAMEA
jgi:hypothetical protein